MPKCALVVTTIFKPEFLSGYVENLRRFGHSSDVRIIVIPDRKTPPDVAAACDQARRAGFDVLCPTLEEQVSFLKRLNAPEDWIPFDSDNRRNVGFLMALQAGVECIISIDDDNYCPSEVDFFGIHQSVGREMSLPVKNSSTGWINFCDDLSFSGQGVVPYPRGYPYKTRGEQRLQIDSRKARLALNVGLWTDDPDVDAISRLAQRPKATAYQGSPFAMGRDTWSPINTQNTALTRQAMAAYYYVRMGFAIEGLKIDRYGDILSGYFVQKCIRHLGEDIRVGDPICEHRRTPHNLFKDLYHELAGMVLIEEVVPWLRELKLTGSSYAEAYTCLANELETAASRFSGFVFDQGGRGFLTSTAGHMRTWLKALKAL